ncbi:hypothetical protein BH09BAC3_BH09BAC3_23490 [soil metagenome]
MVRLNSVTGILCLLINFSLVAQDSLVSYKDLKFTSAFEKETFGAYLKRNEKNQYLPLFLSVSSVASPTEYTNIKTRIRDIENYLLETGIEKRKSEKKVKAVYDQIHESLLKKYEMENRFHDIFANGNYNCVSATALYALIFEDLNIPYEIKQEPTHVYLLAYPNANNIVLETTTPLFGYLNFDPTFKENFVSNLKKQKIIGNAESEQKNTDELFNIYYFTNEKIDIKKLVGIQYMNDALFKNDHGQIKEAYEQTQKAYFFYPSPRCEYMLINFGSVLINTPGLPPKDRAKLIAQLARLKNHGITTDMIKGEFINLTSDLLIRQNNKALYKECVNIIRSGVTDKETIDEVNYLYYYESGRVYYNQGNYTMAKNNFGPCMELQPNNVDLGGMFVSTLGLTFRNERNNKSILDTLAFYQKKFPSLVENNNFNTMMSMCYVTQFGDEYNKGNVPEGDKYRRLFEDLVQSNKNIVVKSGMIGEAYGSACTYFFKNGQKTKAKEILTKGLQLAPDSYELKVRELAFK